MATVNYLVRGTKDLSGLTVRFTHTRNIDIFFPTKLVVPKSKWDSRKQKIKSTSKQFTELNKKLMDLESTVLYEFSKSYSVGEEIDKNWLGQVVSKYFNRPAWEQKNKAEQERNKYLCVYADYFIEEVMRKGKWLNPKSKKPVTSDTISSYVNAVNIMKEFEQYREKRIEMTKADIDFCREFVKWCEEVKNYGGNNTARLVTRVSFFLARADESNIEVNKNYLSRQFSAPTVPTFDPYLNLTEIEAIYNLDYAKDTEKDVARDWLIVGLFTGLRVSDLLDNLNTDHLVKDSKGRLNIEDLVAYKTKNMVTIPVHSKIKSILDKRDGKFPQKIKAVDFNRVVKEVAKDAGLNDMIKASLRDSETNRKVVGLYPKWKTVSSHICRRSFATNHYGVIKTSIIMKIGGWKSESSFIRYLKKSNSESAEELHDIWDKNNQNNKQD